ncbi:MAG: extracellular solute-binding protein [Candidatus Loosdrechtia sp.]|uniref:extracellular solute-binding protein n=1 Tax=Candidatus Loosdrechtia sp. TaxID=3101272 RepID=UPI003A79BF5D|nr:MAG: extracellular solute-binding protein [Candidatus Jettenia sp. AMX2]
MMAIIVPFLFMEVCFAKQVIVYTSVDREFSEPVLKQFEEGTGIKVRAVYDTEETKGTGLVNRLIAEKDKPRADVFWCGDPIRPALLETKGITEPYVSGAAADIPEKYKCKEGNWTGFSARVRVILYNTNLVNLDERPLSLFDLAKPKWKDQVAIANPLFGSTAAHMAVLFDTLGDEDAVKFLFDLKTNRVRIVSSNSEVRRLVVDGEVMVGITDTDEAEMAIQERNPVKKVFPDQGDKDIGTFIMPNVVCLIKGGPHPDSGKKLIDYLLSKEVERQLAFASCYQIPLRHDVRRPADVYMIDAIKGMDVDYHKAAKKMEEIEEFLKDWAGG